MILIAHIIIALASMAQSTYMAFVPSERQIKLSYGLIGATVASGTYLVVSTGSPLLQSCMTGLAYLGVAITGMAIARHRLAGETVRHDQ